jgi:hypothetical protein
MKPFRRFVTSPQPQSRLAYARPWCRQAAAAAVAAALAGVPFTAHALGLGKVVGEPVLGQALRLEIPLIGSVDRAVDSECVSVRRTADALEEDYLPRDLAVRVERQAGAATRLLLTTRSPLRQPLVEFRLVVTCGYNLSNDYLLAVSPPPASAPPAAVANSVPATAAAAASVDGPALSAQAETGQGMPDGLPASRYRLDRAMTLHQLARKHFPGPLRQERFMRWVAEANPELSAGVTNLSQLKLSAGMSLLLPVGVPPRRPGDHSQAAVVAVASDDAPAAGSLVPVGMAATKSIGSRADKLIVGAGGRRDLRETMAMVDRLTAMAEQQLAAQTTANEKIQALETALADLNKYVTQLETSSRQQESALRLETDTVKKTLEDQAEQAWWQLLLAVIAGGMVGAGLMYAFRLFSARATAAHADALVVASLGASEPGEGDVQQAIIASFDGPAASETVTATGRPATMPAARETTIAAAPAAAPTVTANELTLEPPPARELPTSEVKSAPAASDPATAAIELANIMTAMGLSESAAQTLVEHIRENPRQSLHHWLKLLDLHRLNGNREEFERSTEEMRQHFNVRSDDWERSTLVSPRNSLESYAHIRARLIELWRQSECVQFLQSLLMDNRDGTRSGFPLSVAEEILLLIAIQSNT